MNSGPDGADQGDGDTSPQDPPADHKQAIPLTPPTEAGETDVDPDAAIFEDTLKHVATGFPVIPDVTLIEKIGHGGMGTVYRGRQPFIDRDVAVKVLKSDLGSSDYTKRFRREAKLLARMSHPSIVSCLAAGESPDGHSYIVMELIEGPDLFHWLRDNGQLATEPALKLVLCMAEALAYAYEQGIIHRDIKTANVLLAPRSGAPEDDPFPWDSKLVDLGLARPQEVEGHSSMAVTQPGVALGTPSCMSPEQFGDPEQVDFRSDIYGLGCVMFHLLTGRAAFPQKELTKVFTTKMNPVAPDAQEFTPEVSGAVSHLVSKMLATDRDDRHSSYEELLNEIKGLLAGKQVHASTAVWPKLLGGLLVIVAIVAGIMQLGGDGDEPGADSSVTTAAASGDAGYRPASGDAEGDDTEPLDVAQNTAAAENADVDPTPEPVLEPVGAPAPELQLSRVDAQPPGARGNAAGSEVELTVTASPAADGSPASLSWSLLSAPDEARPNLERQVAGFGAAALGKLMLPRVRDLESYTVAIRVEARHGDGAAASETFRFDVDSTTDVRSITNEIVLMDEEELKGWTPRDDSARDFGGAEEYFGVQGRSTRGQAAAESVGLPAGDWILKGAFRALYRDNYHRMEVGLWIGCDPGATRMLFLKALIPEGELEPDYHLSTAEFMPDVTSLYGGGPHAATSGNGIANLEWPLDFEADMSREVKFTVLKNGTQLSIAVTGQEQVYQTVLATEPVELGLFVLGGLGEFRDFKLSSLEQP